MLSTAWAALGGQEPPEAAVRVEGPVPLPSPLPVAELAVGAVAAQLLAAQRLTHGDSGTVVLSGPHVAAAFRSERHYRRPGADSGIGFAPLSRFHRAQDGWVRLHANYPHHERALRRALGPDPVAAIADSSATDVEDTVVAAGGVAAAVRTAEEWAAHPQGRTVAALPLLTLERTANVPARKPPLRGLRVLDLTRVLAGPVATRTLASHGADVLRLDAPGLPEDLDTLLETGSGKRHLSLDLQTPTGRRRVEELLGEADVLVHGYRPGSLDRFGLSRPDVAQRHPHLVVATVSAWGSSGPWSRRRGFDSIVQAASGIADALAGPDGAPGVLPAQALDHGSGHLLAAAVLTAVRAQRDGGTWYAELSLARLAHWLLTAPRTAQPPDEADQADQTAEPPPLLRLETAAGPVEVVAPPGSPPWTRGLTEVDEAGGGWHPR
ncbi:MAG: CoA transferase [Actinomycetota bacterium]|nr:CoA transferase [Actinomycetota bacterium]